jgi:sirohydrochlorin cobaltochelatase
MADAATPRHLAGGSDVALILAAHGSSGHAEAALSVLAHAETLRRSGRFAVVRAGFIRQEPLLGMAMAGIAASDVYVVPVFASRGHIAGTAIARELRLDGRVTWRDGDRQRILLCDPVGTHRAVVDVIESRVRQVFAAHRLDGPGTEIVLVGHGTPRNPQSARQTRRVADDLARRGVAAAVHPLFLEEPPLVDGWPDRTRARDILAVPFLIGSGYHGTQDLPARLGIDPGAPGLPDLVHGAGIAGPFAAGNRRLWLTNPVGNEPAIADIILKIVEEFDPDAGET